MKKIPDKKPSRQIVLKNQQKEIRRRQDWIKNETQIEDCYWKLVDSGTIPNAYKISQASGLNLTTCVRHLDEWDFAAICKEARPATREIISRLADRARGKGARTEDVKLFMQLAHNWEERAAVQQNLALAPTNITIEIVEGKQPRAMTPIMNDDDHADISNFKARNASVTDIELDTE